MAGADQVVGYTMQYRATVSMHRYNELRAGLLDPWGILLIYQDMIEAGCIPAALLEYANNYVSLGLCRIPDQMVYH